MKKFISQQSFWDLFPQCEIGILVVEDIQNDDSLPQKAKQDIAALLAKSYSEAVKFLVEPVLSQNPVVAVWREAFMKFKTKKGARSSIEALLKRVEKGTGVGNINPLVDLYNSLSLRFGLPCGMEDLEQVQGDLVLTVTTGGDDFLALGDEEKDPTLPGEVCYLDNVGAVCRCWNWRDGQRTMLTEKTKSAILVIESVDPKRHQDLVDALATISEWIENTQVGKVKSKVIVSQNQQEVALI